MTVEDGRTRQMPINGWVPAQRAESRPVPAHRGARAPDLAERRPTPAWPARDETMVLPTFVTAPRAADPVPAEKPATPPPPPDDRLPSTERNMLIFVSLLLAVGTLAIVAMASVGR